MNAHRIFIFGAALLTLICPLSAKDQVKILPLQPQSDEEAFLVRRIAEFWKDGDYNIVQSQILTFMEKYPDSSLNDELRGILGDLYLQKDQYERALGIYEQIHKSDVVEKTLINKLQCLYELNKFDQIMHLGRPFLNSSTPIIDTRKDEFHFLMAQSFFHSSLTTTDADNKKDLALQAKPLFESLENTPYKDTCRFALAEIHRTLGDLPFAANLYLELAEENADKREELLFHAANLQAQFKPEEAINTFSEIIALDGVRAQEATFNRMLIFYQLGHHHDVIISYDKVHHMVPAEKQGVFNLIVGKSYFTLEDYASAISHLKQFESAEQSPTPSLKNALLMLMTAAYHQGDQSLFNHSFDRFKEQFPDDPELAKAIFTHAMLAKAADNREQVERDLELLLTQYPDYDDKEGLIFEYASLTYDRQDWGKSYQAFHEFLTQYPYSERNEIAWRYFLSASINLYKESQDNPNVHYAKNTFFNDLSQSLDQAGVLGDEELREYRLLQAKIAYELDLFEVAYRKLEDYIEAYALDPSLSEAHFVAGLASKEINHDLQPVCYHLEKALELNPENFDSAGIHLELYNAYLTLSSLSQDEDSFICKAALHLYEAVDLGTQPIKPENRLWLANYYYNQSQTATDEQKELVSARSFYLFKNALVQNDEWDSVSIDEETLFLEGEVLKLGELLEARGETENKIALLKSLAAKQNQQPDLNWNFQRRTLLELAGSYEAIGDKDAALNAYSFVAETAKYGPPSPFSFVALLKEARLRYGLLDKRSKTEENPEVIGVLNNLKELQIKKQVTTEPIHLEAAIDYAKIRSELTPQNQRVDRHLFFLTRIKEDFSVSDDPSSQTYYSQLQEDPAKNHLFQMHMSYLDAQIAYLEAYKALEAQDIETAQLHALTAKHLLTEIGADTKKTEYLRSKIKSAEQALDGLGI